MAAYVDFTFYTEEFLGTTIPEADFPKLALDASMLLDSYTFDRIPAVIEANTDANLIFKIKMSTCAIAEELYDIQVNGEERGSIASETVGAHSVTYAAGGGRTDAQKPYDVAVTYLGSTGLMYRGF